MLSLLDRVAQPEVPTGNALSKSKKKLPGELRRPCDDVLIEAESGVTTVGAVELAAPGVLVLPTNGAEELAKLAVPGVFV